MASIIQIQLRRDTAANWTANNPILAQSEPGHETDTGKIKYGDGVTAWSLLPYFETDKNFVFTQGTAAASWVVAHNLGKRPSVSVVDTGDNEVTGEVLHTDNNNLTINFGAPFTGKAYLN